MLECFALIRTIWYALLLVDSYLSVLIPLQVFTQPDVDLLSVPLVWISETFDLVEVVLTQGSTDQVWLAVLLLPRELNNSLL